MVRYIQLAHNQRVGGVTQAQVLLNLGREDSLDRDGVRRLVGSINRYLGEPDPTAPADAAELVGDGLTVAGSASGRRGVPTRRAVAGAGRRRRSAQGRGCAPVHHRRGAGAVRAGGEPGDRPDRRSWPPPSGPATTSRSPGWTAMDDDQAYRAMDLLVEADAHAEVQEAVFFAVADLLNLEVDLLFFDTTSTYFERDTEEERRRTRFRRYGHSKDHRDDLPQIVIGLAVTREGIPVRVWCWPGNTNDQRDPARGQGRPAGLAARAGRHGGRPRVLLRRRTWPTCAAPAGTTSPGSGCATAPPRSTRRCPARAATSPGPRQPAGQGGPPRRHPTERFVICHNPDEAERDQAVRDAAVARIADRARPDRDRPHQRAPPRPAPRRSARAAPGSPAPTGRAREGRVRAARSPRPRPLAAPDRRRAARDRPGQDHRRGNAWTASTCSPPPTRTCPPRTSRWATRTSSRPNAASAT